MAETVRDDLTIAFGAGKHIIEIQHTKRKADKPLTSGFEHPVRTYQTASQAGQLVRKALIAFRSKSAGGGPVILS